MYDSGPSCIERLRKIADQIRFVFDSYRDAQEPVGDAHERAALGTHLVINGVCCRQHQRAVVAQVCGQRGNLEMSNIAPQDISNQIPAWSILTSGYLFRDPDHLRSFFTSDVGAEMKALAEGQLGIKILGPTFYGTRQVGLRGNRKIATPADMAGVKLRMPGGEAWQFLGRALGANPTPMAYAEVYTGLQTGAIDGQDKPLPNVDNMKFYEVMDQIVLTSHLVAFDLLTVSGRFWEKLTEEQRAAFQTAADGAIGWSTEQHVTREAEIAKSFAERGLDVYAPDLAAFRSHVQKAYLESDLAKEWPAGMIERIAAA